MTLLNSLPASSSSKPLIEDFLRDFDSALASSISKIDECIVESALRVTLLGGKRLRPTLCYLCGFSESKYEDLLKVSVILELVHVASLVHDDVLDNAQFRRNQITIHNDIGVNDSILLGDALFSYALELSTEFKDNTVCKVVSHATRKTCSGEIAQNHTTGNLLLSLEDYIQIISDKTGHLFGASCELGGKFNGCDPFEQQILNEIGISLGVTYQLYDDIIDAFGNENKAGKSLGTDFASLKPTLPLILLLNEVDSAISDEILRLSSSTENHQYLIKKISKLYVEYGVLKMCVEFFNVRFNDTISLINSLNNTNIRNSLTDFIDSFSSKTSSINNLNESNFLAIHS